MTPDLTPMTDAELAAFAESAPERIDCELWTLLDWALWGAGMADMFRMPLASTMVAAVPEQARAQAALLMREWLRVRDVESPSRTNADLRAEVDRLRAELAESQQRRADLFRRLGEHMDDLGDMTGKRDALAAKLDAADARIAELEELKCETCGMRIAHLNANGHVIGWGCADGEVCFPNPIPLYAQLDLWMALGGDAGEFDVWREARSFADAWAELLAMARTLRTRTPDWVGPAPEMPRPPAEEAQGHKPTFSATQHRTTVRCECGWLDAASGGPGAKRLLERVHAEHVAGMDAEAAQDRAGDAGTPGTGSGRGTGVAEAPGSARASDG